MALYSVRSERQFCEQLRCDLTRRRSREPRAPPHTRSRWRPRSPKPEPRRKSFEKKDDPSGDSSPPDDRRLLGLSSSHVAVRSRSVPRRCAPLLRRATCCHQTNASRALDHLDITNNAPLASVELQAVESVDVLRLLSGTEARADAAAPIPSVLALRAAGGGFPQLARSARSGGRRTPAASGARRLHSGSRNASVAVRRCPAERSRCRCQRARLARRTRVRRRDGAL